MAEFFTGQIMMTGFGYAQKGFAQCNGGLLQVTQNAALFALLGVAFGGDGVKTFGLPDLRGRTPAGGGFPSKNPAFTPTPYALGQVGGVETVALQASQNGSHSHGVTATSAAADTAIPDGSQVFAQTADASPLYGAASALVPLGGGPTSVAGAGAPHDNMQPFQAINFNIALYGIFPSRN